ncbi:ABC transporter substrate-binding protein [Natronoglycomyces albus]|uniref:ABC transporter substrate-binding protein n=1 Tax=Natronoglycomyces albus TaxID=2811108 RepID=A0A895XVW6_9ACTN|nr:ABC transporter substrate-binding protein [Natronoglycomyces albus]QSB06676.1 ABC transporter substrate-binding protein [Natronoglycomyces albus]
MTNLNRRRLFGLSTAAALGALVSACGTGSADSGRPQGILRFGSVAGAGSAAALDPHGSLFNESDWLRHTCVYDMLATTDEQGNIVPALARAWTPDEDATRWTLDLRDDAVFSDGKPVTADDVLFSLGRMSELAAENGNRLGLVDVEASEIVDEHTLTIVTSAPDAELPLTLAFGTFVVPEATTDFAQPVGSGPFTLAEMDDQGANLDRSETWWGEKPAVARVEIRAFSSPQALASAVSSAEVDVAASVMPAAAESAEEGTAVHVRPASECVPLLLRVDTAPFDSPQVRQAVKLALDRQALVDQVYLGYGVVGNDMIKYDEPSVPEDVPAVERDLEKARSLLEEAGYPDGFDVVLHTTTAYPAMLPTATVAAEQLAEVGIRVDVEQHAPEQYWSQAYTVEPFTVGYYADTSFATTVRQTVLSSAAFSETGWKDEEFDADFAAAMSETDEEARLEILHQLHYRMAEEGGWVVWGFGDGVDLHAGHVSGLPAHGNRYDLSRVTLEQ